MNVAVTGGAGYLGALVTLELSHAGHDVTVLDTFMHGQDEVGRVLAEAGATIVRGDVRDSDARQRALDGAAAVVHLAAIVGDPACAKDPQLSHDVNVAASQAVTDDSRAGDVERLIFASTCSNYGRMADPSVPVDEEGTLAPISLYAEQKVAIERHILASSDDSLAATCLRFATIHGAAPRMRFDLTVNEFTRELWADRRLMVFGERFWRPYVHVADAARAIRVVLEAPRERMAGAVFNVGQSDENYRKLDLVEIIRESVGRGSVEYVQRDEDPRDYKVAFEKIERQLGYEPQRRVRDGVAEIVRGLEEGLFGDPFDPRHSNLTSGSTATRKGRD